MHLSLRVDRVRVLLALALAFALLLGGAPLGNAAEGAAQEAAQDQASTDPSADAALGALDAEDAVEALEESQESGESAAAAQALADEPDEIVVEDGVTQPVFSYEDAIRETVRIPGVAGTEDSGIPDIINVDIIRPAASDGALRVPTIIIPSPYYESSGRGRASENKANIVHDLMVGGEVYSGTTLTPALPDFAQNGTVVNCGLAQTPEACGEQEPGFIALIERGGNTFVNKAENAQAAGAAAAIIYNNVPGSFTTSRITTVNIPVAAFSQEDGQAVRDNHVGKLGTLAENNGLDRYALYYDNVFVPRGYAVALLDLSGSRGSTGCLDIGGPGEIDNTGQFVKWLTGDAVGYDTAGNEIEATWSNGKSGMIGKSWDGTVANGVAALGLDGLTTIVPLAAISSQYLWYWHNGARFTGHSPLSLSDAITNMPSNRCSQVRAELAAGNTEDENSDFWLERNFIKDVDKFKASVFVVHGKQDWNVKPSNYGELWDALVEHDVPRKIWLSEVAHEKAFDFRRTEWLETIHRWWDYWLQGVENGIMDEPMADVEFGPDEWQTFDTWPVGDPVELELGQPDDADDNRPGTLGLSVRNQEGTQTFTELRRSYTSAANNPFNADSNRVVFLSDELNRAVQVSGTPNVKIRASFDRPDSHLNAYLVDYGTYTRTNWTTGGGILDLNTVTCFGQGTEVDTGCYRDVQRRTRTQNYEVVSRGTVNVPYILGVDQVVPGQSYDIEWDIMATDYLFRPGHRIGIVIAGVDSSTIANHGTNGVQITVDLEGSSIELPINGGAVAAGFAFAEGELDRLVANGGITAGLEAKIRHALAQAELWLSLDQQRPIAGTHLERAIHLLLWQADVIEQKNKPNQGDADALRALAASLQALLDELPDQHG